MRHISTLLNRELGAYFLGPMAYLVLLAFQVIAFLNFWELVDALSEPQRELSSLRDPMTTYIAGSPAFWLAILVAVPMLTMRLLAEERRSGTIETLLTLPVTETEVVVAKWLGGVVMYCVLLVPFALYLPFLYYQAKFDFDLGPLAGAGPGPDDDGNDARRHRSVLERAHAQSDHRGDLDVRGLVPDGRGRAPRLPVRGAAAHRLGRRRRGSSPCFTRFRASRWASSTCATSPFIFRSASSCST